jgi:hypothetical protein
MLSWGVIVYGAALSVVVAIVLVTLLGRERRPAILVTVAAGALAGPIAWNAILRATDGREFFTDAPSPIFPISWQDTGSGVFTLAVLTVALGFDPLRAAPGRRLATLAGLGARGALLVDVYLYQQIPAHTPVGDAAADGTTVINELLSAYECRYRCMPSAAARR